MISPGDKQPSFPAVTMPQPRPGHAGRDFVKYVKVCYRQLAESDGVAFDEEEILTGTLRRGGSILTGVGRPTAGAQCPTAVTTEE